MQISDKIRTWIRGQLKIAVHIMTQNPAYVWAMGKGRKRQPKGVMIHSTGANNPWLRRYVAPDDGLLGPSSPYHWNQPMDDNPKGVHAFIGKLLDGSVAVYQTLPWTLEAWHCGGKANASHIGFEICEDDMDPAKLECWQYFRDAYRQAALLTAHLCARYGLDPRKDGVVICHCEGHRRGWASNHADVLHWWPRFGRDMDDLRRDVLALMQGQQIPDVEIPGYLLPAPKPAPKPTTPDKDRKDVYTMDITRNELIKLIQDTTRQTFAQIMDEKAKEETPEWVKREAVMERGKALGITKDGDRPNAYTTRAEAVAMVASSQEKQAKELEQTVTDLVSKALDKLTVDPRELGLELADVPDSGTACTGDSCPVPVAPVEQKEEM